MTSNNLSAIAQEIGSHPRVVSKNPFVSCLQAVCSEWLQLLQVVERIKLVPEANQGLEKLVALGKAVHDHHQIQACYGRNVSDLAVRNDYQWNPQVAQKIRALSAADTLFATLDQAGKINGYFAAVNKIDYPVDRHSQRENESKVIAEQVIPEILDSLDFGWENLNFWRLGYSHSLIARSVIFNDKLLAAIEALLTFVEDNTRFEQLRSVAIEKYINEKNYRAGGFSYTLNSHFLSGRPDIIAEVNNQIFMATAQRCIHLIRAISASIGMPASVDDYRFGITVSAPESREVKLVNRFARKKLSNVVTVEINLEDYAWAVKEELGSEFYRQLDEKLYQAVNPEPQNRVAMYGEVNLPAWLYQALWKYKAWVEDSSFIMLSGDDDYYLPARLILRGVKFSDWSWKHKTAAKVSIGQRIAEYAQEGESESTIKQSYEKVRGHAQKKVRELVIKQVEERLRLNNKLAEGLRAPLNGSIIETCSALRKELMRGIPADIYDRNGLTWLIAGCEKLRAMLDSTASSATLQWPDVYDCFELDEPTRSQLLAEVKNRGALSVSELRTLLKHPLLS